MTDKEKAQERLKNNDYMVGGLGMMRRHSDQRFVSSYYNNRVYKSSIIKKICQKIKIFFENPK